MFPTIEVRWFFAGEIPADVWTWFHKVGTKLETQPPRVDHYLRIYGNDRLGVKLREGRIEVKQRSGQREEIQVGKFGGGYLEEWCKWSFDLTEWGDAEVAIGGNVGQWIAVRKERKLHTFQTKEQGAVVAVRSQDAIGLGCACELTKLGIDGQEATWWSVGFEAFGDQDELRDTLLLVMKTTLFMVNAPKFGAECSYGYPRWVQQIGDYIAGND
jgi:hypothetical protein